MVWGFLCVFCVNDTIGNRCFEKTLYPKIKTFLILISFKRYFLHPEKSILNLSLP